MNGEHKKHTVEVDGRCVVCSCCGESCDCDCFFCDCFFCDCFCFYCRRRTRLFQHIQVWSEWVSRNGNRESRSGQ